MLHIDDAVHTTPRIGEHRGQWGDMEWHTTPVPEPDDFYRDCCNIHDVSSIKPRGQKNRSWGVIVMVTVATAALPAPAPDRETGTVTVNTSSPAA